MIFGWMCDRISPKFACVIGFSLQFVATLALLNAHASSPIALIWTFALIHGLGSGSWLPAMSMLASRTFGLAHYGAVFGALTFLQSVGTATARLLRAADAAQGEEPR